MTGPWGCGGFPQFSFGKAQRRVSVFYFYLWDADFGPGFIKVCTYFPYPIKVWINGHEWAKQQAAKAGLEFEELSNGFASTRTGPVAGDLRPARSGHDQRVLRALDGPAAVAAGPTGPSRGLLVGTVDAPD